MARAAVMTASMPEPHSRLMVVPGICLGRPASSSAMRATLRLSSPAWLAQPKMTSSTAPQVERGVALHQRPQRNGAEIVRRDTRTARRRSGRSACGRSRRCKPRACSNAFRFCSPWCAASVRACKSRKVPSSSSVGAGVSFELRRRSSPSSRSSPEPPRGVTPGCSDTTVNSLRLRIAASTARGR